MTKFIELEAKTYSYLIDDGNEYKKAKCTKNCVIKDNLSLEVIQKFFRGNSTWEWNKRSRKNKVNIDSLKKIKTIHKKQ